MASPFINHEMPNGTLVSTAGLHSLTYVNEAGVEVTIQSEEETVTTLFQNTDGSYTYVNEDGVQTLIDIEETVTNLVDNGDGTFTYTNEAGVAVSFGGAEETITTLTDNGDGTYTYRNEAGTLTVINPVETTSTLIDNGNGSYTYTDETGAQTIINSSQITTEVRNTVQGNKIAEYVNDEFVTIKKSQEPIVDAVFISEPEAITFPNEKGEDVHAFYYPPKNPNFIAPENTLPPTIVRLHGGPTGATNAAFRANRQFWTSRGFAIIDINYGGSTGYGRDYRERLRGQWGVVDIDDTEAALDFLVKEGRADREKLLIAGGSAGGYSVLVALSQHDIFAAGANYFGISDLEVLGRDTHKYESRYLDSLIGRYPEDIDIYKARSPINSLDGFNSPLITFQGLLDEVVPPNQSELIVTALREKGVPVAYYPYEGEYHGFGKKENIIHSLESELVFYGRILGFTPAGELPEIQIDNFEE